MTGSCGTHLVDSGRTLSHGDRQEKVVRRQMFEDSLPNDQKDLFGNILEFFYV